MFKLNYPKGAFDDMIPRTFQRRPRYDFRTYDMGCKKVYDFPSCKKRNTLKCGDVLKAFFFFFFFFFLCENLKKKTEKKKKQAAQLIMALSS